MFSPVLPSDSKEYFYPYKPRYGNCCVVKSWMNYLSLSTKGKLCMDTGSWASLKQSTNIVYPISQ